MFFFSSVNLFAYKAGCDPSVYFFFFMLHFHHTWYCCLYLSSFFFLFSFFYSCIKVTLVAADAFLTLFPHSFRLSVVFWRASYSSEGSFPSVCAFEVPRFFLWSLPLSLSFSPQTMCLYLNESWSEMVIPKRSPDETISLYVSCL